MGLNDDIVGWVKSSKGGYYPIKQYGDGPLSCECKGFEYRRKCRHIGEYLEGRYFVEMQFNIHVKNKETSQQWEIQGERVMSDDITVEEVTNNKDDAECFLSRLTGLEVIIEQVL